MPRRRDRYHLLHLCAPELEAGRLVRLMPERTSLAVDVHLIFPSKRELVPTVQAFVDLMKGTNPPGLHWQTENRPLRVEPLLEAAVQITKRCQ